MKKQLCLTCDQETGRCSEDGFYDKEGMGPYCDECWKELDDGSGLF